MKYSHIGRPTNEEISHRKRIKFFKIIIPIIFMIILVYYLINSNLIEHIKKNFTSTCLDGYYLENNKCIKEEAIDATLLGDINKDRRINKDDLISLKNILDNGINDDIIISSDINRDSKVDINDYKILEDYLVNEIFNNDVGKYVCPLDNKTITYQFRNGKCYRKVALDKNVKQYKIVFKANGGTFDNTTNKSITQVVNQNSNLSLPSVIRKGYSFKGWYDGKKRITSQSIIKKDMVLKAKWIVRSDKVEIIFDGDGGSIIKRQGKVVSKLKVKKVIDKEYGRLPKVRRIGYKFQGWYVDSKKIGTNTKIVDETIVKARWIPNKYKVFLVSRHGNLDTKNITVKYGSVISQLPKLENTNKLEFLGWYTSKDGKGRKITQETIYTSKKNTTLYAYWARK